MSMLKNGWNINKYHEWGKTMSKLIENVENVVDMIKNGQFQLFMDDNGKNGMLVIDNDESSPIMVQFGANGVNVVFYTMKPTITMENGGFLHESMMNIVDNAKKGKYTK